MDIVDFYATLKLQPDQASIQKADRWLKLVEKRIQQYQKRVIQKGGIMEGALKINKPALEKKIQSTLNSISSTASFHLNRFTVNQGAMQYAVNRALSNVQMNIKPLNVNTRQPNSTGRTGSTRGTVQNTSSRINSIGTIAGATVGGFGLSGLNKRIQELELLPVSMESVTGSKAEASKQMAFLRRLGAEVGATQRELSPDYTKFFASAQGTALEPFAQSGFRSLTRYGKVMGLDQESMKGTFKAVTQMVNKQQIMAEELKGQLAERLPAAVRLMADAVTGGDTKKLFALMKAGKLDPNTALPKFFMQLEAKAAGGWDSYTKTVRYQQNMSNVGFENLLTTFGQNGGNEAFFRGWKSIADMLPKMETFAKAAGSAFLGLSRHMEGFTSIMIGANDALEWFNQLHPQAQAGMQYLGLAAVVMGTKFGRAFAPLYAMFLILEDIAAYSQGKKSITGIALGKDYDAAPTGIARPRPYDGLPFGSIANDYSDIFNKNPTLMNGFNLLGPSLLSKGLGGLGSFSGWTAEKSYDFNSPKGINLTGGSQLDLAMQTATGNANLNPQANALGGNIFNVTITPDMEGNVVAPEVFKRELEKTLTNFTITE